MKKYVVIIILCLFTSSAAQNFIIGGKRTNIYNKNINGFSALEILIASNNNAYSIGLFWGITSIDYTYDKYKWVYGNESETKSIAGIIAYIYPLNNIGLYFLQPLYLSFTWAKISDLGFGGSAGHVFDETGYMFPNSLNDRILSFSVGYKLRGEVISVLLGVGYQYRDYDLRFNEYYLGDTIEFGIIAPQKEEAFQFDIGLQYVF